MKRDLSLVCVAAMVAASCSTAEKPATVKDLDAQWAANGWLSPGSEDEPEIIGTYLTREECDAAVGAWMSRQAAGAPVRGECLPIDRR